MEIVHEPKYVGSNNLEICLNSLCDAIFNSTVHFKIVTLFSLGFIMCRYTYHGDNKSILA